MSQIWSLMGLLSMVIIRAPNSTPMVRSCTGWKRLSVNCSSRHDLPTPAHRRRRVRTKQREARQYRCAQGNRCTCGWTGSPSPPPPAASGRQGAPADPAAGRGKGGVAGCSLTCVADDDVLEEVGVRHLRRGWLASSGAGNGERRRGRGGFREARACRAEEEKRGFA